MKSKYKYVQYDPHHRSRTSSQERKALQRPWRCKVMIADGLGRQETVGGSKRFATEREAAIHVDKILLEHGREPVNILKRKEP